MNWELWVVVGWLTLAALINVGTMGQERKTTPAGAVVGACITIVLVALVFIGSVA